MSLTATRKNRRLAQRGARRARPTSLRRQTRVSVLTDTHVRYHRFVSEVKVDRDAWATVIADLIREETRGNKAAFARKIGVKTVKTVDRWLAKEVNVSAESVRSVARALGLSDLELLRKVGYVEADEATMQRIEQQLADDRAALQYVRDQTDLPPSVRRDIEESLLATISEQEQTLMDLARRMVDLARKSGGAA